MFSHRQVWRAIDALAQRNSMSVSRLARNAGLDPTTFNKSKRVSNDGRQRWPSTESLAKVMEATQTPLSQFMRIVEDADVAYENNVAAHGGFAEERTDGTPSPLSSAGARQSRGARGLPDIPPSVPLLGLAQAGVGGFFDDAGLPTGEGWEAVEFPQQDGETIYALEVSGDSMLPLYRDGDRIIVSPQSSVRRGDRVVVRTRDGEVMAKILARQTAQQVELDSINPDHELRKLPLAEVDWIARIVWASQ